MRPLVEALFAAGRGMADEAGYRSALMTGAWEYAVGPTVSARTTLVDCSRSTWCVSCADQGWVRQLTFLKQEILAKLACLGRYAPADIRFEAKHDPPPVKPRRRIRPKKSSSSRGRAGSASRGSKRRRP